jgi:hypothetical protein
MESNDHPVKRVLCGARTRAGGKCGQIAIAVPNGRCRYHGGKSLSGTAHGRYKNGLFNRQALEMRRQLSELVRASRDLVKSL